jgi:hypothetical protein
MARADIVVSRMARVALSVDVHEGEHRNPADETLLTDEPEAGPRTTALGSELGAHTTQLDDRLDVVATVWRTDFEGGARDETARASGPLVSVGASRGWGVDVEARYRVTEWLVADCALAYASPRVSPVLRMEGGLTVEPTPGLSLALRARSLEEEAGTATRSVVPNRFRVFIGATVSF